MISFGTSTFFNFAAKERRMLAASQLDNHCGSSAKAKNMQEHAKIKPEGAFKLANPGT